MIVALPDTRLRNRLNKWLLVLPDGCWMWTGHNTTARADKGGLTYGHIKMGKTQKCVHRVSYEKFVGPIPDGYEIDHLCNNTLCYNPKHLEAVTPQVNKQR